MSCNGTRKETPGWEISSTGQMINVATDDLAIEKIPFVETRGYVQRVLENSVVYDRLNPSIPGPQTVHISAYLGKSQRPG